MDDDSSSFCTGCGAPLRDSDTFCASCGANRDAGPASSPSQRYGQAPAKKNNTLIFLGIASAVWAVFALWEGITAILTTDAMIDSMFSSSQWDIISDYFTKSDLRALLLAVGAVFTVSGVLGAITAILCFLKRFYMVALICCIIASICALIILVGIVGLIVAYFIYKNKGEFLGQAASG